MEKTYICPNVKICEVYKMNYAREKNFGGKLKAIVDPIFIDNNGKYICAALQGVILSNIPKNIEKISRLPLECGLIEILNRVKTL